MDDDKLFAKYFAAAMTGLLSKSETAPGMMTDVVAKAFATDACLLAKAMLRKDRDRKLPTPDQAKELLKGKPPPKM